MKRNIILGMAAALITATLGLISATPAFANTETLTFTNRTNAVETGLVTAVNGVGSVFTINVLNPALTSGVETVTYTSVSGDTTRSVASGLVTAINADSALHAIGVTASLASSGATYSISSTSTSPTTYTESVGGTGGTNVLSIDETLGLAGTVHTGDVISLTVHDAGLPGGQETISVTAAAGNAIGNIQSPKNKCL